MKKSYIYFFIILFILGAMIGIYFFSTRNKKTTDYSNYNAARTSNNNESQENQSSEGSENNNTTEYNDNEENKAPIESQIADFTTKIYTKDKERQNNITITCSSLNDTYIEPGETFSFEKIVGKATTSKGYKKADVFQNGEVIQALGGGNCQVSSTLYNAVLKIPEFEIVERHKHSNSVPYVSKGKDAAVSYGSYDFKFKNNLPNKIKISASCDSDYVYIKLFKLE